MTEWTRILERAMAAAGLLVAALLYPSLAEAECVYGEDQCLPGYVWRGAFAGDRVCVTGAIRAATADENNRGSANRQPGGGAYGPNTCRAGFVWRDAEPDDQVCVSSEARAQAADDNAAANARRDPNCKLPVTPASLGILTLNVFGINAPEDVEWTTRMRRVAISVRRNRIVPDIIALEEVHGWLYTPPVRSCGVGFGRGVGDYDQIDALLSSLREMTGVTYRVAYLTGRNASFGDPIKCLLYHAHAILYNPARLGNATQKESGSFAHDAEASLADVPHLRRSLPLCTRGTSLMPLETLIDGPEQTDKCNRPTPSGPAYAVFSGSGHIAGTSVTFTLSEMPGKTIRIVNLHPSAGIELQDKIGIDRLLDLVTPPPYAGTADLYPPIIAGDFNSLADGLESNFPLFRKVGAVAGDVMAVGIGLPEKFPAQLRAKVAQRIVLPDKPEDAPCGDKRYLVSDHCGIFVRFDLDGPAAGDLHGVFVDGPSLVSPGATYTVQAVPSGGSGNLTYVWQPGGSTGPVLRAVAGAGGSTQTWRVDVTDTQGSASKSAQHSVKVRVVAPQACVEVCRDARSACMAAVVRPGAPRPAECIREYNICLAECPR